MQTTSTQYLIHDIPTDFSTFTVRLDRPLSTDEISRASGCIGYALRETLCGEDLSDPEVHISRDGVTTLAFEYDSTKSRRDDPDHLLAFERAATYIVCGTPVRKTDRAGKGTRGTSLVDGVGPVNTVFLFDADDRSAPPVIVLALPDLTALLQAREEVEAASTRYQTLLKRVGGRL